MVQAKLGRSDQARRTIDRALAASPEDGDVLYGAAVVGALASDSRAACDAIRKALEAGFPATVARHDDDLARLRPPCEALGARR
jgi:Flp pilus assembly protein TadD